MKIFTLELNYLVGLLFAPLDVLVLLNHMPRPQWPNGRLYKNVYGSNDVNSLYESR